MFWRERVSDDVPSSVRHAALASMTSPLLSNTASNEARKHWLLEQRLTAPLDKEAPPAAPEALSDEGEARTASARVGCL